MTDKDVILLSAAGNDEPTIRVSDRHDADAFVEIGSVTKTFTAALLHVLAEEGRVGLDDRVSDYVEIEGEPQITLRHLAEHTSGLPRLPPGVHVWRSDPYKRIDQSKFAEILHGLPRFVRGEPGRDVAYSNFGYGLLGAALASASGLSWIEAIQSYVVKPLDLDERVVTKDNVPKDRRLVAVDRKGRPRDTWTLGPLEPAGGLWTTPRALADYTCKVLIDRVFGAIPIGWRATDGVDWHNGATRDAAVFVGARSDTGRWAVCHGLRQPAVEIDAFGLLSLEEKQV